MVSDNFRYFKRGMFVSRLYNFLYTVVYFLTKHSNFLKARLKNHSSRNQPSSPAPTSVELFKFHPRRIYNLI